MYIHEAVSLASESGGYITRRKFAKRVRIKPTDSDEGLIIAVKNQAPYPRWQPRAEDLIADDWMVTTEELT